MFWTLSKPGFGGMVAVPAQAFTVLLWFLVGFGCCCWLVAV